MPKSAPKTTLRNKPAMSAALQKALSEAQNAPLSNNVWKASDEDNSIAGRVLSIGEQSGKFGLQMVVFLDTGEEGATRVFCNKVLAGEIQRHGIKVGDEIAIAYRGKVPSSKGNDAKMFAVAKVGA